MAAQPWLHLLGLERLAERKLCLARRRAGVGDGADLGHVGQTLFVSPLSPSVRLQPAPAAGRGCRPSTSARSDACCLAGAVFGGRRLLSDATHHEYRALRMV